MEDGARWATNHRICNVQNALDDSMESLLCSDGNCSPMARRVVVQAVTLAEGAENLNVEHLFLGLLSLDSSLIFTKLRRVGIDLKELIHRVWSTQGNGQGNNVGVLRVLGLASKMARGDSINNQHLLAAILLEPSNTVARCLRDHRVNMEELMSRRFAYVPAAVEICRILHRIAKLRKTLLRSPQDLLDVRDLSVRLRKPWVRRLATSPVPTFIAERKAMTWLAELIPDQADRYRRNGFIEIESRLYPGKRVYRIHRENIGTEIHDDAKKSAISCIHTMDAYVPKTDRVLAEFLFIRGDEQAYLKTANITPV